MAIALTERGLNPVLNLREGYDDRVESTGRCWRSERGERRWNLGIIERCGLLEKEEEGRGTGRVRRWKERVKNPAPPARGGVEERER